MAHKYKYAFAVSAVILIAGSTLGCSSNTPITTGFQTANASVVVPSGQGRQHSSLFNVADPSSNIASASAPAQLGTKGRKPPGYSTSAPQSGQPTSVPAPVSQQALDTDSDIETGAMRSRPKGAAAGSPSSDQVINAATESPKVQTNEASSLKTPVVGSPEWKRDQRDSEEQEQRIRRVIEGICRNC
jgi:hypothetical protein